MKIKKFVCACFSLFLIMNLTAQIRVGILNGPSAIPCLYLMDNTDFSFDSYPDPQALLPKLLKNEIDIGFMPLNVAAKVYNSSNKKIKMIGVCGNGNLSIITKDKKIRKLSDLKGKTVHVAGMGATPEYVFKYILKENNLPLEGNNAIELDFSIPAAQLAAQLIAGKIEYALVPEPFASIALLKSKEVRCAINLQDEYEELRGKGNVYPLTVIVTSSSYTSKNNVEIQNFIEKYKEASDWTIKNPVKAGALSDEYKLGLSGVVVTKSIPSAGFTYIPAEKSMEKCEELLKLFMLQDPKSIGGKLPDKDFYY